MTEPPDFVAEYLQLVTNGAEFNDPRLASLRRRMTAGDIEVVKQRLIAEYIKELPPATDSGAPDAPVADFADLYLEIVRRGARPDDRRLAMLADGMSPAELDRCKAAIGELWLRAEPPGRPN